MQKQMSIKVVKDFGSNLHVIASEDVKNSDGTITGNMTGDVTALLSSEILADLSNQLSAIQAIIEAQ